MKHWQYVYTFLTQMYGENMSPISTGGSKNHDVIAREVCITGSLSASQHLNIVNYNSVFLI